jgi:serine/threonine protein kinase
MYVNNARSRIAQVRDDSPALGDIVKLVRLVHARKTLDKHSISILRQFSINPPNDRIYKLLLEGLEDYILMEVLSYIYYDTGILDFDQKIDSRVFFDSGRYTEFRPLEDLRNGPVTKRETILVDETIDEDLRDFVEEARKYVHRLLNEAKFEVDISVIYKLLSMLVNKRMRNPKSDKQPDKVGNVIKIGSVTGSGVCRHCAILFKYLCDKLTRDEELMKRKMTLLCRLCRGKKYEDHAWNIVVANGNLFLIDVMNNPTVMERDTENTAQYKRGNFEALGTVGAESVHSWFTTISSEEQVTKIGSGKYAVVHSVKVSTNVGIQTAARKTVQLRVTSQERLRGDLELARREIELSRYCFHRNLVPYKHHELKIEKTTNQAKMILYMELMQMNAETFTQQSKLKGVAYLREALILLLCVARGIRYLHNKDHMHRDIKPSNVMLNIDPNSGEISQCKVGDFGTSKKIDSLIPEHSINVGTPIYQDPKVNQSGSYSLEVDVYSLGVMIRAIVCRKDPTNVSVTDMRDGYDAHPVAVQLAALQLLCCSQSARPDIDSIVTILERTLIDHFVESNPSQLELRAKHKKLEYEFEDAIMCVRSLDVDHIAITFRSRSDIEIWLLCNDGFLRVRIIPQNAIQRIWEMVVVDEKLACASAPVSDQANVVVLFNWKTGDTIDVISFDAQISAGRRCIHFLSPTQLIVCLKNGIAQMVDLANTEKRMILKGHNEDVMCAVSAKRSNGQVVIATGGIDRKVRIWDSESGECIKIMDCVHRVISLCLIRDLFVCGTSGGEIKAWDVETLTCTCDHKMEMNFVNQVDAIDSSVVVSVVNAKATVATTKIFDLDKKVVDRDVERREPRQAKTSNFSTVFTIHNGALVVCGKDGILRYFN